MDSCPIKFDHQQLPTRIYALILFLSCTQISVRAEQWAIIKYADDFVIAIQLQDNETNPVLDGVMSTEFN